MAATLRPRTGLTPSQLALVFVAFAAVACDSGDGSGPTLFGGSPSPFSPPEQVQWCSIDNIYVPKSVDAWGDQYFDPNDFSFLGNPGWQISSIDFLSRFHGEHGPFDPQPSLGMNGLQCTSNEGFNFWNMNPFSPNLNSEDNHFRLDEMRLNGGMTVTQLMTEIYLNNGQMFLTPYANNRNVDYSQIEIIGQGPCPSPSPSPSSSPAPSPSPSHSPSPTPSPSESPSPKPSASPTPSPTPTASPSPTPVPSPSPSPSPSPLPPPTTSIVSATPSGAQVNSSTISFQLSSNQVGVTYQCSLDGSARTLCSATPSYSGLSNGNHTFFAAATSSAGLTDPVGATYTWLVETTPPTVTITNASSLPTLTNQTSINFQFTAQDLSATSYTCSLDGAAAAACTSPQGYSGLAQGTHNFSVSATDGAGNVSPGPATFQWTINLTPPTVQFTDVNPSASLTNSTTMTVAFGASESATFTCSQDGASYTACTSPTTMSGLLDGQHSFDVIATDLAGNVSQPATLLWTVDTVPPVITLGQVTPLPGLTNATVIAANFTASEQVAFACTLDGASQVCVSPFTATISTAGPHELDIVATDQAGNVSQPVTVDWTMDYTIPQLAWGTVQPPGQYINTTTLSATVTSNEAVTLACALNDVALPDQTSSPIGLSGLTEGSYTLQATGTDLAGNVGSPISYSFVVMLTPPTVTISETAPALSNQTTNVITFSADETTTFTCNQDGAGFAACTSPAMLSGLANGQHTFQVQATDLAGNQSQIAVVTWTVDTVPPVTSAQVTQVGNASFDIALSANEEVANYECSLDGSALAPCSSPVSETGLSPGTHTFTAEAIDLAGNTDPAGVTVTLAALPPITTVLISVTPSASLTDSTTATFVFGASQSGATFVCSLDGSAPAACTSPQTYSGLASVSHAFQVNAIDAYGEKDMTGASYTWTVLTTPPVTSIAATQTGNANFSLALSANQAVSGYSCTLDGAAYTCSASATLTGLAPGTHTFWAAATDLAGNTDPTGASVSLVALPPITTSITSEVPSASLTNSTSMSISFAASQSGATFVCSLDGSAPAACTSPQTYSGLASASHTFQVSAIDKYGEKDMTGASYIWTVFTTPPVTSIAATQTGNANFSLALSANQAVSGYSCTLDGAADACGASVTLSLAPGTHTFWAAATDLAGNTDPTGASVSLVALPPITTGITAVNPSATLTNSTTATFSFAASQSGATFLCSLDGAAPAACTSPLTYSGLASSSHTFQVNAIDPYGEEDMTGASYGWTVNTTPPVLSSVTSGQITGSSAVITWTTDQASTSAVAYGTGGNTNLETAVNTALTTSHSVTVNGLNALTVYTFHAVSTDSLGNTGTSGNSTFKTSR